MADGDVVISLPAVTAAPLEYDVKQAEWFAIKQVQALYTDNTAAGAWLPALEIVAPGGIVTGRYVGTSVAAGDGQEVTFYPLGSKGAGAAPTTATSNYAGASLDCTATLFVNSFVQMFPADYLVLGNTAMYQDDGSGRVEITAAGLYEITWSVQLQSATEPISNTPRFIQRFSNSGFPNHITLNDPGTFAGTIGVSVGPDNLWNVWETGWLDLNSPPCSIWMTIFGGGTTHTTYDSATAYIRIVRLTEASSQGL